MALDDFLAGSAEAILHASDAETVVYYILAGLEERTWKEVCYGESTREGHV